jgi:hypothetical protein
MMATLARFTTCSRHLKTDKHALLTPKIMYGFIRTEADFQWHSTAVVGDYVDVE